MSQDTSKPAAPAINLKASLTYFLPALAFAAVAVFLATGLDKEPKRQPPAVLLSAPVPTFELAEVPGRGQRLTLADLKGGVSLVNVFGSWCPTCHVEHPFLLALARQKRVPLHGIAFNDKPADTAEYLRKFGDPYGKVAVDQGTRIAVELGISGAPETLVVDANGVVRHKHLGMLTEADWREVIIPVIERLEAEASGGKPVAAAGAG